MHAGACATDEERKGFEEEFNFAKTIKCHATLYIVYHKAHIGVKDDVRSGG